jgi:two-component system, sensor histidine kinase LadS
MIDSPAHFWAVQLNKAIKCMRSAWVRLLALLLGLMLLPVAVSASLPWSNVDPALGLKVTVQHWIDPTASKGIDQVAATQTAIRFEPLQSEKMFNLGLNDRLWIRVELDRSTQRTDHVILWIPLPLLDSVKLHQKDSAGRWMVSEAGDKVAVASWPEPGRYPRFHLELPPGKSTIYLQVASSTPVSLPIHISSEQQAQAHDREGFLGLGLVVGVLLTLVITCFVTAYTYRDRLYMLYGFYMLVMVLAVGAYTGLSAYLLWDQSPKWADAAQGVLAMLSVGGAFFFIVELLGTRKTEQRLTWALNFLALASLPLALAYMLLPRAWGVIVLGVYVPVGATLALLLAGRAWLRGDQVGKWICIAYLPLALAVSMAIARAFGWVPVSWWVQYGVTLALLIEAPTMMVALHVRSRERHEIKTREQAMATHDALTGLLKEHLFDYRVNQAVKRSALRREDAAIVIVSLVNHEAIFQAYGSTVAEQSVLRAVIKLRRVLGDIETLARLGPSRFGLILEGPSHRDRITELGARIVAQGLMPLPGLVPSVILQFHVAAACLRELPPGDRDIKKELQDLLSGMSRRTHRPIRFLEVSSLPRTGAESPIGANPTDPLTSPGSIDDLDTPGPEDSQPTMGDTLQLMEPRR